MLPFFNLILKPKISSHWSQKYNSYRDDVKALKSLIYTYENSEIDVETLRQAPMVTILTSLGGDMCSRCPPLIAPRSVSKTTFTKLEPFIAFIMNAASSYCS
jgi:hypothetical protein